MSDDQTTQMEKGNPPDLEKLKKAHSIIMLNGRPFDIPETGSLGLLALGYRGLFAWRSKRDATQK